MDRVIQKIGEERNALHFKVLDCSNGKWQTRKLSKVAEEYPYLYIMIAEILGR